jgi:hypothetical protein
MTIRMMTSGLPQWQTPPTHANTLFLAHREEFAREKEYAEVVDGIRAHL